MLIILVSTFSVGYGNELVLSGTYTGTDIFVQNPFNRKLNKFCTEKVFVNDRIIFENPSISAYKIDLSYLKIEDLVVIRIVYSEGCVPTIVNPHALKKSKNFQLHSFLMFHHFTQCGKKKNIRKWFKICFFKISVISYLCLRFQLGITQVR